MRRNPARWNESKTMNIENQAMPEPLLYDIKQAAVALNCCTKTVRRLIKRRLLTPCKALRKVLIPRKQIEEFIKATCGNPKTIF